MLGSLMFTYFYLSIKIKLLIIKCFLLKKDVSQKSFQLKDHNCFHFLSQKYQLRYLSNYMR